MTIYAGLDVSDKATHICVVDGGGAVVRRDVVASDPGVLAKWLVRGTVSNFVREADFRHQMTNLSPKITANWVFASVHSRGGLFHSAAA